MKKYNNKNELSNWLARYWFFFHPSKSPTTELVIIIISQSKKKKKKKKQKFVGQQTSWFRAKIKNNISSNHSPYSALFRRRKQRGGHCGVSPSEVSV